MQSWRAGTGVVPFALRPSGQTDGALAHQWNGLYFIAVEPFIPQRRSGGCPQGHRNQFGAWGDRAMQAVGSPERFARHG
jgi:hypothetical protein